MLLCLFDVNKDYQMLLIYVRQFFFPPQQPIFQFFSFDPLLFASLLICFHVIMIMIDELSYIERNCNHIIFSSMSTYIVTLMVCI